MGECEVQPELAAVSPRRVLLAATAPVRLRPTDRHPASSGPRRLWNRLLRTRPFPYPRQVAGSAMALFYVIGGLTSLLVLTLPHPAGMAVPLMFAVSGAAVVLGLATHLLRHRLPVRAYPWLLAIGTAVITVLTSAAGSYAAMVSFSFAYLWVVLYAVLFFSPIGIAVQVGLTMVGYWVVSALYDDSAVDVLTPLEPIILVAVIGTTSTVCALLSRAREASEVDPLTRVANRRGIDNALAHALQFADRIEPRLTVAMIDVDHFKAINDENGHEVGDQVLQHLTAAWEPLLRPRDIVGRRGGDEFLVVLPGCTTEDATAILERLRTATPGGVTCSLGAAHRRDGDSASMLVNRADAALYEAKRRGRDRVVWASTE